MQLIRASDTLTYATLRIPKRLIEARTRTIRIDPDVDEPPPDPELGDEYTPDDEATPPEDPDPTEVLDEPNLIYASHSPGSACPECRRLLGTVWKKGQQPRLPRHDRCNCYYIETWSWILRKKRRLSVAGNISKPESILLR